jgi:hypothetical protein
LFFVPAVIPVTFTENVQPALATSVAPESEMVPDPAVAVMVPPPHDPVRPFGVATTKPPGRGSLNPMFDSEAPELGFCTVNESDVVPPTGIVAAPNTFEIEGGTAAAVTPKVALAVEPVPPFVEVTAPVVLLALPGVLLVTFTVAVHVVPGLIVAPLKERADAPDAGANVALLQFVVAPAGDATVMPEGKVSVKLTPLSASGFAPEFPSVKVRVVVPPAAIETAPKSFEIVGGPSTDSVAVA